jgi:hypothetical protein
MSERRPGVPRLRHGVGVGVGHFCAEGTVHSPIVSRSHASWTQNFGKKRTQKLWYTAGFWYAGWESRSLGWVTGVDARATGMRRLRGNNTLASMPPHAHLGGCQVFLAVTPFCEHACHMHTRLPGVPHAALLHGRLQLSSGTTVMLDSVSLTHWLCASHRECAAAANCNNHPLCTMDAEKREQLPEPLDACVPPA